MDNIILGSNSPRRKEILSFFSLPFTTVSPTFDEAKVHFKGDPQKYVELIAYEKYLSLRSSYKNHLIITSDTVVYLENQIFEKPKNFDHACKMLTNLCGKWHEVLTAITVNGDTLSEKTKVKLFPFSKEEITLYLKTAHTLDKAAAYAIQGAGNIIVEKIDGCFYNVMGLPLNTLRILLKKHGINLLNHIK